MLKEPEGFELFWAFSWGSWVFSLLFWLFLFWSGSLGRSFPFGWGHARIAEKLFHTWIVVGGATVYETTEFV